MARGDEMDKRDAEYLTDDRIFSTFPQRDA